MQSNYQTLNPWVSIWTKPRETIQQIVDTNPKYLVLALAAAVGFSQMLDNAVMDNLGDTLEWPIIFITAAIGGSIVGLIGLYIGGALIRWTGTWIGGTSSQENIRAAMAWSTVPVVCALVLWVPEIALFGQELFTTETPTLDAKPESALVLLLFGLIEITAGIWSIVLSLQCLGQVQGFSAWKALGNLLLAGLVFIIPITVALVSLAVMTV